MLLNWAPEFQSNGGKTASMKDDLSGFPFLLAREYAALQCYSLTRLSRENVGGNYESRFDHWQWQRSASAAANARKPQLRLELREGERAYVVISQSQPA